MNSLVRVELHRRISPDIDAEIAAALEGLVPSSGAVRRLRARPGIRVAHPQLAVHR